MPPAIFDMRSDVLPGFWSVEELKSVVVVLEKGAVEDLRKFPDPPPPSPPPPSVPTRLSTESSFVENQNYVLKIF